MVSEFAVTFHILAAETSWDQIALQGVFRRGLSDEVRDELAVRDDAEYLDERVDLAFGLDNRLRERCRERESHRGSRSFSLASNPPLEVFLPSDAPPPVPSASSASSRIDEPMELGRSGVSPQERRRCMSVQLYIYWRGISLPIPRCPKDQAQQ